MSGELVKAKKREASDGWSWFGCGWRIFTQKPLLHVGFALLMFAAGLVFALIPIIGSVIFAVISPVLMAAWYRVFREQENGNPVGVEDIFAVFGDAGKRSPLLQVGVFILVSQLAIALLSIALVGGTMAMGMDGFSGDVVPSAIGVGGVIALVVLLIAATLVFMALYFAVPRIMFADKRATDALTESYRACKRNIGALTVFGLIYLVLALVAVIPFGLGFVVLVPVSVAASYCAYKAVFE